MITLKILLKITKNILVLINDINSRTESIRTGLIYINNNFSSVNNIIIHDSAIPFLIEEQFKIFINKI
jgi:2-C-methyl-D-erythritol 4-phosphate cytidylyltransferase